MRLPGQQLPRTARTANGRKRASLNDVEHVMTQVVAAHRRRLPAQNDLTQAAPRIDLAELAAVVGAFAAIVAEQVHTMFDGVRAQGEVLAALDEEVVAVLAEVIDLAELHVVRLLAHDVVKAYAARALRGSLILVHV